MPGEIIKKFKLSKGHLEKKSTDLFRTDTISTPINLVSRTTFVLDNTQLNFGMNPLEFPYTYAPEDFAISDPQICSDENFSITDCIANGGTLETNFDLGEQRSGGQVGSSFVVGGMGLLGKEIVTALLDAGAQVIVIDIQGPEEVRINEKYEYFNIR